MQIPTVVLKYGTKAGHWLVKNGPKIASIAGAGMTIAGAVMACEATLRADDILEEHKAQMAKINEARALSDELVAKGKAEGPNAIYTYKQMKEDKARVYFRTAMNLAKLYAPAAAVGFAGVGLMEAAFIVTERRRATAIAALTTMEQAYNDILTRSLAEGEEVVHPITRVASEEAPEQIMVDTENVQDPFFFIFDKDNPNWYGNTGYLLNCSFIKGTIDTMNLNLSAHAYTHFWVNDLLERLDIPTTDIGHFHGWNAAAGDIIDYELIPYVVIREDEMDTNPLYIEKSLDELRELELNEDGVEYAIGIRLKSSSEGYAESIQPRMIYHEVYGG